MGHGPRSCSLVVAAAAVALSVLVACDSPSDTPGSASPSGTCPVHASDTLSSEPSTIEWVDFVYLDGRSYIWGVTRTGHDDASVIDADFVGSQIARVCFDVAEITPGSDFNRLDGDATFLPVDTPIHAIRDSDPAFRVAVDVGEWRVYEVTGSDDAATGADLFDFTGGVESISVGDPEPEFRPKITIDDPDHVARLVAELLEAPATATPPLERGRQMLVVFDRPDGSATVRVLWPDTATLAPSVVVGDAWLQLAESVE